MNRFLIFAVLILSWASTALAEQALILTEIEQVQEKVWYLQRDIASQTSQLQEQKKQIEKLSALVKKTQEESTVRLQEEVQHLEKQQEEVLQLKNELQELKSIVTAIDREVKTLGRDISTGSEKTGTQEGLLKSLQETVATQATRTEQAFILLRDKLEETRAELESQKATRNEKLNQIVLWGGGLALGLVILLTSILIFRGGSSKKSGDDRRRSQDYEL